jgi:hypothetical protein
MKRRGRFLEKSTRPLSSESPLKHESASYFSIANYAVNLDFHCALGPTFTIENGRKPFREPFKVLERLLVFYLPIIQQFR